MRGQAARNSLPGAVISSTQAGETPHRVPASATAILAIPAPSTGNTRRPRHGSHPSRTSKLTSAAIDARDFLRARDQSKTQAHLPGAAFEFLRYPWSALMRRHSVAGSASPTGRNNADRVNAPVNRPMSQRPAALNRIPEPAARPAPCGPNRSPVPAACPAPPPSSAGACTWPPRTHNGTWTR